MSLCRTGEQDYENTNFNRINRRAGSKDRLAGGLYREDLPDKDDVKDYLDATLSDTINNLPSPPNST